MSGIRKEKIMKENIEKIQLVITAKSVFIVVGILLFLVLIYKLTAVLYIFFLSFSIYSTLRPIINKFERKYNISRNISIPLILFLFLVLITLLLGLVVQNLSIELRNINIDQLVNNFVEAIEKFVPFLRESPIETSTVNGQMITDNTNTSLSNSNLFENPLFTGGSSFVIEFLSNTAGVLFSIFTIFVVAYYMLLKKGNIFEGLLKFIPDKGSRATIRKYLEKVEAKLGSWLMSQFFLMLLIGFMTYIGVMIPIPFVSLDNYLIAKFAVTLAVISGILEVVPNIGPIITFFVGIFLSIALGGDFVLAQTLYIGFLLFIVQQIEAAFIVPKVMRQAVGLDPIVTVLGVIAGGILAGPIGAVLIIPVIATAQIVIEFFVNEEEFFSNEPPKIETEYI
jgi:predicted PurR-regulated permease PerM